MDAQLRLETIGGIPVLSVAGELDLSTLPHVHSAFVALVGDHPGAVVALDLDGVDSLDDTCLGVMLGTAGRARESGGDLVVVCSDERLLARFALVRLDRAIDVAPSVHDISSLRH